jgi:hypothetical protein
MFGSYQDVSQAIARTFGLKRLVDPSSDRKLADAHITKGPVSRTKEIGHYHMFLIAHLAQPFYGVCCSRRRQHASHAFGRRRAAQPTLEPR